MHETSVVIPAYNSAATISEAVESVLDQTYDDLEIIVVDDASTDRTAQVVRDRFPDEVEVIQHEENLGGAAARNTGIDAAQGSYIAFLDADDVWLPTKLERQLEYLQQKADEFVGVHCREQKERQSWSKKVQGGVKGLLSLGGGETYDENAPTQKHQSDLLSGDSNFGNTSTFVVEAQAVREIGGFDEQFPRHQDWEFLVRLLDVGKMAFVDEGLVIRGDTGRPSAWDYEETKAMYLRKFHDLVDQFEADGVPVTRYNNLYLTKVFFRDGHPSRGWFYLKRSSFKSPAQVLALGWSVVLFVLKAGTGRE